MKRFINDNVVLVPGIRTAPRITQDELRDIIINAAIELNEEFFNWDVHENRKCAGNLNEELEIAASIVVQKNKNRLGKTLVSDRGEGEKPTLAFLGDANEEATYVADLIKNSLKNN